MSKPPKVVIPGLNRGAGIPPGYILGRRRGTGKGPAELLDLAQMKGAGLATTAQVTQVVDQLSTALSTTTAGLAGAALMLGAEGGEDGASGPPGQAGTAGAAGSPGPAGPPGFALDGLDGEEGMPIPGAAGAPGSPGATGPQGPLGFAQDGEDGQDGMIIPRPRSAAVQATVVHELPMGKGVTSFYRANTAKSSWPLTCTVSSVSGATLTIGTPTAQDIFAPAHMTGVCRIRIWNTSRNLSAWVQDAPTTSTLTVTSAADIAAWTFGDAITVGEPDTSATLSLLAIDIAPMMLATLGRVFPQAALSVRAGVIPTSANSQCQIELWNTHTSGGETIVAGVASTELFGNLENGCTDLSPISNTNLIYIRDPTPTPVNVSLMSAFAVTETITLNGEEGMPGPPGGAGPPGGTGPQGPMGFALDGQDGEEGMPIPGAPGPQGPQGSVGPQGSIGFGLDGIDGEEGMAIPGVPGAAGAAGGLTPYIAVPSFRGNSGQVFTFGNCGGHSITIPVNCTIKNIVVFVATANGSAQVAPAIYSIDGAGNMNALLAQGPLVTGMAFGINTLPLTSPLAVTKGQTLWICVQVLVSSLTIAATETISGGYFAAAGALPSTAAVGPYGSLGIAVWPEVA